MSEENPTIVERLRHMSENCGDQYQSEVAHRAADTIEQKNAEIAELEEKLAARKRMALKHVHLQQGESEK